MSYVEKDWQYLVILDACRWHDFKQVYAELGLDMPLQHYDSGAGNTRQWYGKHWSKPVDVNLVSAHPYPFSEWTDFAHRNFKSSIRAWKGVQVNPVRTLHTFIDNKQEKERYLIHFIPPHLPYIGEYGKYLLNNLDLEEISIHRDVYSKVGEFANKGNWDKVHKAYLESLRDTLILLLNNRHIFNGKTIITSDHSEFIGEDGMYGHDPRRDTQGVLRRVPWMQLTITK